MYYYTNPEDLLDSCKRLHDYSYFIDCVRGYLKQGFQQKEAIVCATEECIEKGILKDVLVKHRAEVVDMFLTTFDKKMYEDAIRMDATADGLERGMKQGLEQKLRSIVEKKLIRGDSVEKIADDLMEDLDTVQKIVEQLK